MNELNIVLLLSSAIVLGIFLGDQIAEACLFIPIWKRMKADDFFEQHKVVGPMIYRFFAPLTIAATVIPLAAVVISLIQETEHTVLYGLMGASTLVFFATYPLYFKNANQKFEDRSISNKELPQELAKWERWHWARIVFEASAFVCATIILLVVCHRL